MIRLELDENGWFIGAVKALPRGEAYTLFTAQQAARLDAAALASRGGAVGYTLELVTRKVYPRGATPIADVATVLVTHAERRIETFVQTLPIDRARPLRDEAIAIATSLGGAGMDALVRRAARVWQVNVRPDDAAALAVAAALSSALLGAILPPDGPVFGPKTARERLAGT